MAEKPKSYAQLSEELSELIAWFESDQVDLDAAIAKYDEAITLITEMETYLKTAENKIKKITADLD
jgi:exodeoxyribonuclease VII small subunit